jgi:hypothetical protein
MLWLPKPTNLYKNNPSHQTKGYASTKLLSPQKMQQSQQEHLSKVKPILQPTTNSNHPARDTSKEINPSKRDPKEIHDHAQRLLHVFSNDRMKETSFHVTDFAGLYPVWPIIEFSMAPT